VTTVQSEAWESSQECGAVLPLQWPLLSVGLRGMVLTLVVKNRGRICHL
jgi:hypothetical protein